MLIIAVIIATHRKFAAPLPPPQHVRLSTLTTRHLNFRWSQVTNCSTTHYIVNSSRGCGICTKNTSITSATCIISKLTDFLSVCTFIVQPAACGNQLGLQSRAITVNLKRKQYTNLDISLYIL